MDNISKYLRINFLASSGKTLAVSFVTLLLLPLVIQRLGLELFGIISLTLLFSEIATIFDLGLSKSIVLLTGEKKITENRVITAAFFINLILIAILSIIFITLQLLSIDLLGKNLNLPLNEKFILINSGYIILILALFNNFIRAIFESNYLIHVVNISLAIYTPLLFSILLAASYFTKNIIFYITIPLLITTLMLFFNILIVRKYTQVKLVKIKLIHLKYVTQNMFEFLNIGLINSIVIPVLRYSFILMVANIGLYAIFDLSFKIALIINSFIVSISVPMFAVFSNNIKQTKEMIILSYKIFGISLIFYLSILLGFYFFGDTIIQFLNLGPNNSDLLYSITFILLISVGSMAVVEVFYRYFLGSKQLKKAYLLKLIIPISCFFFFLILEEVDLIYRFIYAYGASLIISAILILFTFTFQANTKLKYSK